MSKKHSRSFLNQERVRKMLPCHRRKIDMVYFIYNIVMTMVLGASTSEGIILAL